MEKRVLVFGDIHGEYDKLMDVWNEVKPTKDDTVIFLGDYIDRGKDPVKVIRFLLDEIPAMGIKPILLPGNHELMALEHVQEFGWSEDLTIWTDPRNGGDVTLRQINELCDDQEKRRIFFWWISMLKNPMFTMDINGKTIHFVHAGIDPNKDMDDQTIYDHLWIREEFFNRYNGDDIYVIGHTPVQTFGKTLPFNYNNIIFLDTGSYLKDLGGMISCIDLMNEILYQG